MKKIATAFIIFSLCFMYSTLSVFALDNYKEAEVAVPFTVEDDIVRETVIAMKAVNDEPAPLVGELTVTDGGEFTVKINKPGEYSYYLYQVLKSDSNVYRDDTLYTVTILATNEESDGKLEISIVCASDKSVAKPTELSFHNHSKNTDNSSDSSDDSSEPSADSSDSSDESSSTTDSSSSGSSSSGSSSSGSGDNNTSKDQENSNVHYDGGSPFTGSKIPLTAMNLMVLAGMIAMVTAKKKDNNGNKKKTGK